MEQNDLNIFETGIDETGKAHLLETTRWTKFLGICFIILMVLFLAYFIFIASFIGTISGNAEAGMVGGVALTIVGVVTAALYIYPIYALLKFSSCMKRGIHTANQDLINEGFRYQKTMYRYMGILTIISLFFCLISFIFAGIGMMNRY